MFELCKSASFGFSPSECLVLLGEICEQLCKHGIVFDETMVEVGETKKATNTPDHCGCRPFGDSFYLGIVHADAIMVDEHSEVIYSDLKNCCNVWLFWSVQCVVSKGVGISLSHGEAK